MDKKKDTDRELIPLKEFKLEQLGFDSNGAVFYITAQNKGITTFILVEEKTEHSMPNHRNAYTYIPPRFHGQETSGERKEKTPPTKSEQTLYDLAKKKMGELTPEQIKQARAESEKNENLIIMLNNQIQSKIISHGLALIKHDEMKLWRYKDEYSSMRVFMAAVSCQAHGYHAMAIANELIVTQGFRPEQIESIGEKKLMMIIPMVKGKSKKEATEWVEKARDESASDLKKIIKKERGEPVSEVEFFVKGNELFLEKGKLFLRCKDPNDVYDLTSFPKKYPIEQYKISVIIKIEDRGK